MRKLAIFTSALLLVCSMSGCSQSSSSEEHVYTKVPDNSEMSASDDISSETTIVDAFENINFSMASVNAYPEELNITIDSENALLGDSGYDMEVVSAGTETILLHVALDMEKAEVYQQENNCVFEEQEKDFEIEIQNSDIPTYLISESLFTDNNRTAILKDMQNTLINRIEEKNSIKPDIGVSSDNPELQVEVDPDNSTDVTLEGLYIVIPEENVDYMQSESKEIAAWSSTWNSDIRFYENDFLVYGIYSATDGAYYLISTKPAFEKGVYSERSLELAGQMQYMLYDYDDGEIHFESHVIFPDKDTALQCIHDNVQKRNEKGCTAVLKEIEIEE